MQNKNYVVVSGNFSPNGNYSGYTADGERIFIAKRQMEGHGWAADKDVKFPILCVGTIKTYNQLEEDGTTVAKDDQGNNITFDRLTALSTFTDEDAFVQARTAGQRLEIKMASALVVEGTTANLTAKQLESLLAASV